MELLWYLATLVDQCKNEKELDSLLPSSAVHELVATPLSSSDQLISDTLTLFLEGRIAALRKDSDIAFSYVFSLRRLWRKQQVFETNLMEEYELKFGKLTQLMLVIEERTGFVEWLESESRK